jgi:hypothetical protein
VICKDVTISKIDLNFTVIPTGLCVFKNFTHCKNSFLEASFRPGAVVQAYNRSYSKDGDWEGRSSRSAWAKSSQGPISTNG